MTEGTTPSGSGTQPEVPAGDQQQIAEIQAEASQQQAHDAQYAYAFQQTTSGADPSALQAFTVQEMTQQAAGAGKGFEFSPQQIDDILKDAQGLMNDLQGDRYKARRAHELIKAPSPDPVSLKYEKAAKDRRSGTSRRSRATTTRSKTSMTSCWRPRTTTSGTRG